MCVVILSVDLCSIQCAGAQVFFWFSVPAKVSNTSIYIQIGSQQELNKDGRLGCVHHDDVVVVAVRDGLSSAAGGISSSSRLNGAGQRGISTTSLGNGMLNTYCDFGFQTAQCAMAFMLGYIVFG